VHQFVEQAIYVERLGNVLVDTQFDCAEQVFDIVVGTDDDDWLFRHKAPYLAAHGESADARHLDVGDDDVRAFLLEQSQAFLTVTGDMQLAHPGLENHRQLFACLLVILHVEECYRLKNIQRLHVHLDQFPFVLSPRGLASVPSIREITLCNHFRQRSTRLTCSVPQCMRACRVVTPESA